MSLPEDIVIEALEPARASVVTVLVGPQGATGATGPEGPVGPSGPAQRWGQIDGAQMEMDGGLAILYVLGGFNTQYSFGTDGAGFDTGGAPINAGAITGTTFSGDGSGLTLVAADSLGVVTTGTLGYSTLAPYGNVGSPSLDDLFNNTNGRFFDNSGFANYANLSNYTTGVNQDTFATSAYVSEYLINNNGDRFFDYYGFANAANRAAALQTARTINGTSFDGTADIGQDLRTSASPTFVGLTVSGDATISGLTLHENGDATAFVKGGQYGINFYPGSGTFPRIVMRYDGAIGFSASSVDGNLDEAFYRGGSGTIQQRSQNGVIAQAFQVFNTYTDASNYERGVFDWTTTANTLTIGTQAAGTGTARNVLFIGSLHRFSGSHVDGADFRTAADFSAFSNWFDPTSAPTYSYRGFIAGGSLGVGMSSNHLLMWSSVAWGGSGDVYTHGDTGISRNAAGVIEINNGTPGTFRDLKVRNMILDNVLKLKSFTVATLPLGTVGDVAYVSDALAPAYNTTLVGGGSVKVKAFYNGSNWVAG